MGACSSKPKTADFEGVVISTLYSDALQIESEKKSLDQTNAGCKDSFIKGNIDLEQKFISSDCATQSAPPVENTHGYVQNVLLELGHKPFAIISLGHSEKTKIQSEACDVESDHRAFGDQPDQKMPSTFKTDDDHHTFQKEKADTQTQRKSVSFRTDINEARACKDVKSGESQTQDEPVRLVNGTRIHDSEDSLGTQSPLIISKTYHDSEWTTLNFTTIPSNSSSELISGLQRPLENFKEHLLAAALENLGVGDVKGSSRAFAASTGANGFEPHISSQYHDDTQVVSDKESSALNYIEPGLTEETCTNLIKLNNTPQEPDFAIKQVVEVSKEHMAGYRKHFAAYQPSQLPEQGLHVSEPTKPRYNKLDVIADMDQMLEKLASEFERQESLSSYSAQTLLLR